MSKKQGDTNIKVCCRLRPVNKVELEQNKQNCVQFNSTTIKIKVPEDTEPHTFAFDAIFGADITQQEVFEIAAKPVIEGVLCGYNGTIFAYGQTGSGKTHTMEGPDGGSQNPEQKGIIPRMMNALFQGMVDAPQNLEFQVKVSFLEIYMERIHDLLDPGKYNLMIKEDKTRGIYIKDCSEVYVDSVNQMLDTMRTGGRNRSIAATRMNERSSRSHSIFIVTLFQKDTSSQTTKLSKLYFIDLAGSEKVGKTNASGQQLEEAKMINKSLSALGNVINALTESKAGFVPYRDSKLTRILQESLGGNAKTTLIICASMNEYNARETLSTCRFGARAKKIQNKPIVNQERSVKELEALLAKSDAQIQTLTNVVKKATYFCKEHMESKFYQQFESIISGIRSKKKKQGKQLENKEKQQEQEINPKEQNDPEESSALTILNQNNQLKDLTEQIQKVLQEKEEIDKELKCRNEEIEEMNSRLQFVQSEQDNSQLNYINYQGYILHSEESIPPFAVESHRNRNSLNQSEISFNQLQQYEDQMPEDYENPSFVSTATRDKSSFVTNNQAQSQNPSFISQENAISSSFLSVNQGQSPNDPSFVSSQDVSEMHNQQTETSFQESDDEKMEDNERIEEMNNLIETQKQVIEDFTKLNIQLTEKTEMLLQDFSKEKEQFNQKEANFHQIIMQQKNQIDTIQRQLDLKVRNIEEERKAVFLELEQKDTTIIDLQRQVESEKELYTKLTDLQGNKNIQPKVQNLESRLREMNTEKSQIYNQL